MIKDLAIGFLRFSNFHSNFEVEHFSRYGLLDDSDEEELETPPKNDSEEKIPSKEEELYSPYTPQPEPNKVRSFSYLF